MQLQEELPDPCAQLPRFTLQCRKESPGRRQLHPEVDHKPSSSFFHTTTDKRCSPQRKEPPLECSQSTQSRLWTPHESSLSGEFKPLPTFSSQPPNPPPPKWKVGGAQGPGLEDRPSGGWSQMLEQKEGLKPRAVDRAVSS